MARVIWTREALSHLELIADYIEQFDREASVRFAGRLFDAAESLRDFPRRGRPDGQETRALPIVPPYVIRDGIFGDTVVILDIRHGRRKTRP